jgi:hypothetical protein
MANNNVQDLLSTLLQRKKQPTQNIPQVSSQPHASVKSINRYGPTYEVFNPALEQAKEGVKGVVETQQALKTLNSIFDKADVDIPAMPDQETAFKKGVSRGLGSAGAFGVVPAQAFGMADEGAMSFGNTKEAFGTQVARGLGERGVVTNQDVERIFRALPKNNDTVSVRTNNRVFIKKVLSDRINQYNQIYSALKRKKSSGQPVR